MGYGNSKMERSSKNYLKLDMISMNDRNVGKQTYLDFLNRTPPLCTAASFSQVEVSCGQGYS